MGDFSDKSLENKHLRIPINVLFEYIKEAHEISTRQPPKRFQKPKSEIGLKFDERSLSTTRVRQRLCELMGTDVIRLNDKRYFQTLTKRLQDEYETTMDKQEDARAASEDQRLRRLMLEGIIDAPNDYRAVVLGHDKKQNKKKKRRKIKRHTPTHVTYDLEYKASDDEGQSKTRKEDVVTQVEILSGSRPSSLKSRGTSDDRSTNVPETRRKSVRKVSAREKENERISQKLNEDESNATTTEFDTQSLPDTAYFRKQSKYSTHEPERVTKLRTEETVARLYSIAEELISPVRVTDQPQRKVVTQPKKKKMTFSLTQR
ncbi:uncharacterized protein LOC132732779 isoform X13 [Ruditapes philippinarum]|uniref:uncharacterized protein LOC132732779 isoform X13 n=1 Tax=Ruditapes philippinarum TaxID=129788 RepID=UPI00295AAEDC|nr:uncharacterized protein LOC132732779 isoform X13 [Ruditapes philippinarum]